ncbi:MAG: hypothetical protein GY941_27620 [Planctomycetes bacterium]|nr:hypothetical protein [Planctomycetota bacterium]
MRSDRGGQRFSLLVFNIDNTKNNESCVKHLIDTMQYRRLRLTDEIGWFDNKHIGVLLHNTGEDGSWHVVRDIQDLFSTNYCFPDYKVYVYPLDNMENSMVVASKRIRERFNVVTKCLVNTNGDNSNYGTSICQTVNISASGVFLEAEDLLPIGTQIGLNMVPLSSEQEGYNGEDYMTKITGAVLRTDNNGLAVCFDNEYDVKSLMEHLKVCE